MSERKVLEGCVRKVRCYDVTLDEIITSKKGRILGTTGVSRERVQHPTGLVEKMVRLLNSTKTVVSTKMVVCCRLYVAVGFIDLGKNKQKSLVSTLTFQTDTARKNLTRLKKGINFWATVKSLMLK